MRTTAVIGGRNVSVYAQYETIVRTSNPSGDRQDTNDDTDTWDWFWRYNVPTGNFLGFSNRRDRRYGMTFHIWKDTTSDISDDARIRLVVYRPDNQTMESILMEETYGTLKNANRYDIQTLIVPNKSFIARPGHWIRLEKSSPNAEIVDEDQGSVEIGILRMTT